MHLTSWNTLYYTLYNPIERTHFSNIVKNTTINDTTINDTTINYTTINYTTPYIAPQFYSPSLLNNYNIYIHMHPLRLLFS